MITKADAVLQSKEYIQRFENIAKENVGRCDSVYNELSKAVVRCELCSGSDMFLGYYCPSPVLDLIVGNVHRGKILKRTTKRTKPTHKYGFDKDSKLLITEDYQNNIKCYYIYEDNMITTICFSDTKVKYIVECDYNSIGRIVRYTLGSMNEDKCYEIEQEVYYYGENWIEFVAVWDYIGVFTFNLYKLQHDTDGYLSGYESLTSDFWKNHIFEITKSKSRKV